jgi:hypothetical protein
LDLRNGYRLYGISKKPSVSPINALIGSPGTTQTSRWLCGLKNATASICMAQCVHFTPSDLARESRMLKSGTPPSRNNAGIVCRAILSLSANVQPDIVLFIHIEFTTDRTYLYTASLPDDEIPKSRLAN